jgi:hypothetical protein
VTNEPIIASQAHIDHFWTQVNKNGPIPEHKPELGPCWLWTGRTDPAGYGRYSYQGIVLQAHVFSWNLHKGLPMNQQTRQDVAKIQRDHLCRVRNCIHPEHLEQTDRKTNILRGIGKPAQNSRKEECEFGHGPENLRYTPKGKGGRRCLECDRLRAAADYAKLKATGKPFKWGGVMIQGGDSPTAINASKTHCIRGHLITGVKKDGKGRYCKECYKIASRERMRQVRGSKSHRI